MESAQTGTFLAVFTLSAVITYTLIYAILHTSIISLFVDSPNARKVHTIPIPRIGGLAIVGSVMGMLPLWYTFSKLDLIPPIQGPFWG
ncbi:MAG: hypothetical protein ACOC2E_07580, partial [Bacteroidota bacterium]